MRLGKERLDYGMVLNKVIIQRGSGENILDGFTPSELSGGVMPFHFGYRHSPDIQVATWSQTGLKPCRL